MFDDAALFQQQHSVDDIINLTNSGEIRPFILAIRCDIGRYWARRHGVNNRTSFSCLHDPNQLRGTINPVVLLHDSFLYRKDAYDWSEMMNMMRERSAIIYDIDDSDLY